ncbi:MAG: hypothetical protein NZ937_04715 [Armatimonadetes bacterium]|nr:hypothetical protein [Armatimonadota bacterium]
MRILYIDTLHSDHWAAKVIIVTLKQLLIGLLLKAFALSVVMLAMFPAYLFRPL